MDTSKIVAIVLIIGSLAIGYIGYNKVSQNTNEVNVLGVKLEASNESGQQEGYLFIGLAALVFVGGIYTLNKSKS
ncbi:MAG: hypothetical protein V4572_04765 [Bacteroidota bacterium]